MLNQIAQGRAARLPAPPPLSLEVQFQKSVGKIREDVQRAKDLQTTHILRWLRGCPLAPKGPEVHTTLGRDLKMENLDKYLPGETLPNIVPGQVINVPNYAVGPNLWSQSDQNPFFNTNAFSYPAVYTGGKAGVGIGRGGGVWWPNTRLPCERTPTTFFPRRGPF